MRSGGGWREEFGSSVGGIEAYFPGGVVNDPVMMAAQEREVVERGPSARNPVSDVVGVAHDRWSAAARESAVRVSEHKGAPDRRRDQAAEPADVEDLAAGAEDGRDD